MRCFKVIVLLIYTAGLTVATLLFGGAYYNINSVVVRVVESGEPPEGYYRIGGYTTYYTNADEGKKTNILTAAQYLQGTHVEIGGKLSFNERVGARTQERGFVVGKVIVGNEYVDGVGGGVCQVSTTLYNAWITSGLGVEKVSAHSLPSGYVPLSRDATVSEWIDMVLINDSLSDVYVWILADDTHIAVRIYSRIEQLYEYNLKSEKIAELTPPVVEEIVEDAELIYPTCEIIDGAKGYKSRAVLEKFKDGEVVESKVVREDTYYPIPVRVIRHLPLKA